MTVVLAEKIKKHITVFEDNPCPNCNYREPMPVSGKYVNVSGLCEVLKKEEEENIWLYHKAKKDKEEFANLAGGKALAYRDLIKAFEENKKEVKNEKGKQ